MLYTEDSFKDLQDWLDKLNVNAPNFFPDRTTINEIVFAYGYVVSTEPIMNDDEISYNFLDNGNAVSKGDKNGDASNERTFPQSVDECKVLDLLRD